MSTTVQTPNRNQVEMERIFQQEILPLLDNAYNFALSLCRKREDAEDITQEALFKAFQSLDRYETGTNAKAWLFTIIKNTFINWYRRSKTRPSTVNLDDVFTLQNQSKEKGNSSPFISTQESQVHQGMGDEVTAAINSLGAEHRLTVLLYEIEGFSYEEIAALTDVPIGTVRSRLSRGRKSLQEMLHPYAAELGYRDHE